MRLLLSRTRNTRPLPAFRRLPPAVLLPALSLLATGFSCQDPQSPLKPPDPPAHIYASVTQTSSPFPSVAWRASPDAARYTLYRHTSSDTVFEPIADCVDTAWIDTAIAAGMRYVYAVSAANIAGESSLSAPDSAFTTSYVILHPREGDSYRIGDSLSVVFSAAEGRNGTLDMTVNGGEHYAAITNADAGETFVPVNTPVVTFVVPPVLLRRVWDTELGGIRTDTLSCVSDSARVRFMDYSDPSTEHAISNGFFSITESR